MMNVDWLLFDVSDGLSYRSLDRDLHRAAWTSGTAVTPEHTLEVASHSYDFLTIMQLTHDQRTVESTDSIHINENNHIGLQQ